MLSFRIISYANNVRIHPLLRNTRQQLILQIAQNCHRSSSTTPRAAILPLAQSSRPKRIILLRHGQSEGNIDESAYVSTPDWKIPLTPHGRAQSSNAGLELSRIIGKEEQIFLYYSPYKRTRETMEEVCRHFDDNQLISKREEPRISEQQFGNLQDEDEVLQAKKERHEFGRFYYRFRSGEAGLDVYSRVSSFISTLLRDCKQYEMAGHDLENTNVVIILHGLSLRLFLMRWFQCSVVFC